MARTVLLLGVVLLVGCKNDKDRPTHKESAEPQCTTALDCAPAGPCSTTECFAGQCRVNFAPKGESCDNETVCDGVATCDGSGHCIPGTPPVLDDQNACTVDTCDPKQGVSHQLTTVDDGDTCTVDACDPRTGEVTHGPVDVDDGDDCTQDSCDRSRGVIHERKDSSYTCAGCPEGLHAASKRPNAQCEGLQTFCVPSCGSSFYSCDGCPKGYRAGATTTNPQCGSRTATQTFCVRE